MDEDDRIDRPCQVLLEFTQDESCGKVVLRPESGTKRMLKILTRVHRKGREGDIDRPSNWNLYKGGSPCGLGQMPRLLF